MRSKDWKETETRAGEAAIDAMRNDILGRGTAL
jgi:hypothetical protein